MSGLVERLIAVHESLAKAEVPHAFGGAIALAYCTQEPRGTRDLDVNIFTAATEARGALAALPDGVQVSEDDIAAIEREGQRRLWWEDTPIDVFFNNLPLHEQIAEGVRMVPFAGTEIPVLDCASLVMFKVFFNRTKDWADIEAVAEHVPEELDGAAAVLKPLIGEDSDEYKRLLAVRDQALAENGKDS